MDDEKTGSVLGDVYDERVRQDARWGEQNHDPAWYGMILMEEVGEYAKAALENRFGDGPKWNMRIEAIQVAAVAVAIVERLDRLVDEEAKG